MCLERLNRNKQCVYSTEESNEKRIQELGASASMS
jgi:hypothetical protein